MRKSAFFFIPFFLSALFFSCDSKGRPNILGTWEANITLRTELGDDKSDSPVAFVYTKQNIILIFAEGGVYTKKVGQVVDRVELADASEDAHAAKEYFSQFFNKSLTFDGEYQQERSSVYFVVNTVRGDDDEGLSYAQYFVKDPSIGEEEYYAVYELKEDGELLMDGVAYKRAG